MEGKIKPEIGTTITELLARPNGQDAQEGMQEKVIDILTQNYPRDVVESKVDIIISEDEEYNFTLHPCNLFTFLLINGIYAPEAEKEGDYVTEEGTFSFSKGTGNFSLNS